MSPPVMLSKLLPPAEKLEEEKDRFRLVAGLPPFVITDILVAPSGKYGKFAKINGYDIIGNRPVKYRTTSAPVIQQLETLLAAAGADEHGKLKSEVKVQVAETKSKNGRAYLSLQDPA